MEEKEAQHLKDVKKIHEDNDAVIKSMRNQMQEEAMLNSKKLEEAKNDY